MINNLSSFNSYADVKPFKLACFNAAFAWFHLICLVYSFACFVYSICLFFYCICVFLFGVCFKTVCLQLSIKDFWPPSCAGSARRFGLWYEKSTSCLPIINIAAEKHELDLKCQSKAYLSCFKSKISNNMLHFGFS
jgi:hypothetical protein